MRREDEERSIERLERGPRVRAVYIQCISISISTSISTCINISTSIRLHFPMIRRHIRRLLVSYTSSYLQTTQPFNCTCPLGIIAACSSLAFALPAWSYMFTIFNHSVLSCLARPDSCSLEASLLLAPQETFRLIPRIPISLFYIFNKVSGLSPVAVAHAHDAGLAKELSRCSASSKSNYTTREHRNSSNSKPSNSSFSPPFPLDFNLNLDPSPLG